MDPLDAPLRAGRPGCALGIGILLGARWSYSELGWGGYWAWDPVENASLMPWLTGTAFIHSIMIQERRGMLKIWNASLILATGVLAILGTFLVRSGILDSIHAFGASTLGVPFVSLIAVMVAGLDRARRLAPRDAAQREPARLAALARGGLPGQQPRARRRCALVIFFGTFFPLISEAVTGDKASVGPPWFDQYIVPLALVLVAAERDRAAHRLAARIGRRRASQLRSCPCSSALAAVVLSLVPWRAGSSPPTVLMFGLGAFVLGGVTQEFWRGARARRAMSDDGPARAVVSLVRRNRRRYGGYIVHAGMALLFIGIAGSSALPARQRRQPQAGSDDAQRPVRGHLRAADVEHHHDLATVGWRR